MCFETYKTYFRQQQMRHSRFYEINNKQNKSIHLAYFIDL